MRFKQSPVRLHPGEQRGVSLLFNPMRVPPGTQHDTVQRLRGEGPPRLNGRGRGDIHYRLTVDVPRSLSKEQKEAVDELANVMNGNPRERLFGRS